MSNKPIPGSGKCKELYATFCFLFPQMADEIQYYGPYDRCSLQLRTYNGFSYIFEYLGNNDWGIQTERRFIHSRSKQPS